MTADDAATPIEPKMVTLRYTRKIPPGHYVHGIPTAWIGGKPFEVSPAEAERLLALPHFHRVKAKAHRRKPEKR